MGINIVASLAAAQQTTSTSTSFSYMPPANFLALGPVRDPKIAKIVPFPVTYRVAANLAIKHFPNEGRKVVALLTSDLDVCNGQLMEITEEAWDAVKGDLKRVYFRMCWE
ncbi:hypothetical protein V5O48_002142 [Marasmius crinis-equi]|uniref:Uncharacterized protein n=1 Tax=Marasmius crinis-equi TaxID=585013 RepID=A0ABR3FWN5_9AGAR